MTENEIIEILQTEKTCVTRAMKNECNRDCYNCDLCEEGKDIFTVYDAVIKALEEREQYRAIGTVEEFKRAKAMENVYGQVKWERDVAISQLEEIGISLGQKMDEFKALKEKSVARKLYGNEWNPVHVGDTVNGLCPVCMTEFVCITPRMYKANNYGYCKACGQKLDWSE